jgi:kynurenine formamidase
MAGRQVRTLAWVTEIRRRKEAASHFGTYWSCRVPNEPSAGEPGVAPEVCDHLAESKASMLGMDNWGIEPYDFAVEPPSDIEWWWYCHANLVTRRGIYLTENMDLKQISDDQAYEFLFAWAPLKLVGATGSPGNPITAY